MRQVSFAVKKDEARIISKIAARAVSLAAAHGIDYEFVDADMDITATHVNGCPLKLDDLLAADEFNFGHDVFGIRNCLDRETGKLTRCFLPRFHAKAKVAA
jgi:CxxC motif-containing protein